MTNVLGLPDASFEFFKLCAEDAGNWGGSPLIGGNINAGRSASGYMKKLNEAGLTRSYQDEDDRNCYWLTFTREGRKAALKAFGFDPDPESFTKEPEADSTEALLAELAKEVEGA